MIFVANFKVYHPLLFRNLLHNLKKFSTFPLCPLNSTKIVKIESKCTNNNSNGINNEMAFNESTAIVISSGSDNDSRNSSVIWVSDDSGDEQGPSDPKSSKQESKQINDIVQKSSIIVKNDNVVFKTESCKHILCNPNYYKSVTETSTLQTVYLLSDDPSTSGSRQFSTVNARPKRGMSSKNFSC